MFCRLVGYFALGSVYFVGMFVDKSICGFWRHFVGLAPLPRRVFSARYIRHKALFMSVYIGRRIFFRILCRNSLRPLVTGLRSPLTGGAAMRGWCSGEFVVETLGT